MNPQQVDGRRATLTVRFYALLVLAGLLFLLGNLVTSPNLPDTSRLAALGTEGLMVSVLNWDFATLNLLIVAVWVVLGLSMTWLTQRFFATKGASGWLRIASLVAATCLGVSLVGAVTSLPPGLRPQTPSLPDSLGLARLSCTTGPGRPDGVKPDSAFLFAAGQTLALDATTQCRGESDPSEVNFYLVVGTASFEGEAAINEDLGNARALALMDTLAGDAATPSRDDPSNDHRRLPAAPASRSTEVYALNLGAYDPDPTVPIDQRAMTAWAAASVSRNADERLSRTLDAMAASAYQRKIVVLQGYSHHGGSASREEISAALGEWLCRGAKLDEGAFQTLTGLDARKYQVPVQCLGGRIALMSRQDVRDEIALATARREAREAKALTQALEASRPPHHRVRLILNGRKADAAPPAITAPGQ